MFDPSGFGLEVGPSYNPLLAKSDGYNVETIDHADAATLREKYKDNASKIEEVDYVSDGRSMLEIIGTKERYDFIFASHVIEHVTDIVRFLQDCEALLKPDGKLVLAVPDKRYCFDALRPISTVGQALQAYAEKRDRHPPGVIFDQTAYGCMKVGKPVWAERSFDDVHLVNAPETAKQMFEAALATEVYRDAHGWQFTPSSFRHMAKTLRTLGYIGLGEADFYKYPPMQGVMHEFYICLSKGAQQIAANDVDLLKTAEAELREIGVSLHEVRALERDLAEAKEQIASASEHIRGLEQENAALLRSTSWRITAPLRFVRTLFRRS
jgi:predicted SAM-dependent methyltransferase